MTVTLPELPYPENALEPYISARTVSFHYGKHHATYVKNTNDLIAGTDMETQSLREIIFRAASDAIYTPLFNNAAQCYNHSFYWLSLTNKEADKVVPPELLEKLNADFGSVDAFKSQFKKAAAGQFGSGWAWLVQGVDGHLKIITTGNADTPLVHPEMKPLLCVDVWEHAYYLDYQNARAVYLDEVIEHLLNWRFAAKQLIQGG